MTADQLLIEIRHVAEAGSPESATVRRKLAAIANRPGAAQLLLAVVRTGEPFLAQIASLALPYARGEMVRRAIKREARGARGERRLSLLASLTREELEQVLRETSGVATDELVEAAGLIATNSPGDFVEVLCEGTPEVDEFVIDHIERVRRAFAIGAAALYGPLLERRLSPTARRKAFAILGRESGHEVRRLLERAQARATAPEDQRALRREQMRQATLTAEARPVAAREGLALLHPLDALGQARLDLLERLPDGRCLHSTVHLAAGSVEHVTAPADTDLETCAERIGSDATHLSLGQARWFLEALPAARRAHIAPLVERLLDIPPEPIAAPAPGEPLALEEARALVVEPSWQEWRPLLPWIAWPEMARAATSALPPDRFPARFDEMLMLAGRDAAFALGRPRFARLLSASLRHMALVLHLRGDARAPSVAAEAAGALRRRVSPIVLALAERERWRQLWAEMPLPPAYRAQVRELARARLTGWPPGSPAGKHDWARVQVLDLAQAAAEGLAREAGARASEPGLRLPDDGSIALAIQLADRAAAALADRDLQQRIRAGQHDLLAETARGWMQDAPAAAVLQLVRFAAGACFGTCPHRCVDRKPRAAGGEVFQGEAPA